MYDRFTIGQIVGIIIFVITCNGLSLAGFHGGTGWSLLGWVALSLVGGPIGGLLMARSHRFAGFAGGFVAGPLSLLAVYLYARNRQTIHTAETFIVMLIASLPGYGVYWILRLITDAMFGSSNESVRPRPRRILDDEDDDEDDDDRPRRRRRRVDDDGDEDRPRRRRRRDDDD